MTIDQSLLQRESLQKGLVMKELTTFLLSHVCDPVMYLILSLLNLAQWNTYSNANIIGDTDFFTEENKLIDLSHVW